MSRVSLPDREDTNVLHSAPTEAFESVEMPASFDDLVLEHSLVAVSITVVSAEEKPPTNLLEGELLIELQCEV